MGIKLDEEWAIISGTSNITHKCESISYLNQSLQCSLCDCKIPSSIFKKALFILDKLHFLETYKDELKIND